MRKGVPPWRLLARHKRVSGCRPATPRPRDPATHDPALTPAPPNRANRPDKMKILQLVRKDLSARATFGRAFASQKKMSKSSPKALAMKRKKGEVKFGSYISKIVKMLQADEEEGNRLTASSAAIAEVGLLMEHAIKNVTFNAGAILKYNGAETVDKKTVETATATAFSGSLKTALLKSGTNAVNRFDNIDAQVAEAAVA